MELAEHPFFEQINKDHAGELIESAIRKEYPANSVIFEEGSPSDGLYLVLKGTVTFCKFVGDRHRDISNSNAGEFFGEIGLFTGQSRSLRAESREDVVLYVLPKKSLVQFIQNTPGPIDNILQNIVNHLHETTRHYMEDMLKQEKMVVVGSLTNTIIHDFKNPFCLISLAAQLIERQHKDEQTQKLCKNIDEQINRMVTMAEEINMFSRGKQNLTLTKVNLPALFERFKTLNFPYFQNENININIDVPDVYITGEDLKLIRVFQNLVGNAIDAFGKGKGIISITAENLGDIILVKVRDNGSGIPEEIHENFFEPFVTFGKSQGTGLGTAIAKSIVEAHGGKIWFETEKDKGTTFFIQLPAVNEE